MENIVIDNKFNLQIRLLSNEEAEDVYYKYMKKDFPRNELRPYSMIEGLFRKGIYYAYGVFEKSELCAYAFLVEETESKVYLLDYFAVCKRYRNRGYGTKALELLFDICKDKNGIILEVEDPLEAENETEREICLRRIAFYERCGIQMSEVRTWLFNVDYCIMVKNLSLNNIEEKVDEIIKRMYLQMIPKMLYKTMFCVKK